MVNVSITSSCNRKCSFCFAKDTMEQSAGATMTIEQFDATLDFIERSEGQEVRILGGEPTIHPEFVRLVDRALERNLRVLLISGGLIPHRALTRLAQLSPEQLRVLLNVAVPHESPKQEVERQREVMAILGERIVLGINIHSPAVQLDFLLDRIEEFSLARQVRLGLTHPMMTGDNVHLHPRYFDEVGRRVAEFGYAARERDVHLEFDCGWVPCMFPAGSLEELGISPEQVGLRCNPILDVLPSGNVISCYPLAEYLQERLADWQSAVPLATSFADRLSSIRAIGIFKRCSDCSFRDRGECVGGCHALAMRRMRDSDVAIDFPDGPLNDQPTALLQLSFDPARRVKPTPSLSLVSSSCGSGGCGCKSAPSPVQVIQQSSQLLSISPAPKTIANKAKQNDYKSRLETQIWSLPYIDQPLAFWENVEAEFGNWISNVYLPLPDSPVGSGRPPQASDHTESFLRQSALTKSVLLNVTTFAEPVAKVTPAILEGLKRVHGEYGVTQAVVANFELAQRIHEALPDFSLTASVLMEVVHPYQARLLNGVCTTLVPGSGITRDLAALRAVRAAFQGRIRLLVNEACLPLCPYRAQHFREMAEGVAEPKSLCLDLLAQQPWLRLTGSWILPQHLHLFTGIYDELKLAGRVTLRDTARWRRVIRAYVQREKLLPSEIGGGPSSVLAPIEMPDELYQYTLECGRKCHECTRCPDYYEQAIAAVSAGTDQIESRWVL